MAHTIKEADGSTRTTTQVADSHNTVTLTEQVVSTDRTKGARVYIKESVAANGDVTWRFLRMEPAAK